MRILALGDIVGHVAIDYLAEKLWAFRTQNKIDFCVANGENATEIRGISASDAEEILGTGVDLITLGNHAFGMKDIYSYLDANEHCIIRPANYPTDAPGVGYTIFGVNGWRVLCINVSGRVYLDPLASPFDTVDRILDTVSRKYGISTEDIKAKKRSANIVNARHICIYLIRQLTDISFDDIGDFFSRDHSTIISAFKKIDSNITSSQSFANEISELMAELKN